MAGGKEALTMLEGGCNWNCKGVMTAHRPIGGCGVTGLEKGKSSELVWYLVISE
jgi:hypothetical protein